MDYESEYYKLQTEYEKLSDNFIKCFKTNADLFILLYESRLTYYDSLDDCCNIKIHLCNLNIEHANSLIGKILRLDPRKEKDALNEVLMYKNGFLAFIEEQNQIKKDLLKARNDIIKDIKKQKQIKKRYKL